jgi:hypothetical protein
MGSPSRPQPRARPPTRNPPELIQARKTTRSKSSSVLCAFASMGECPVAVPIARMRADLLAVAAPDVADLLSGCLSMALARSLSS